MNARRSNKGKISAFVGLSLLLHLHIALIIIAGMTLNPEGCQPADVNMPIEVALVPTSNEPREEIKPEELDKAEKEEEKKEDESKGQVVDLPPPLEEKRPDKARFRSEYDSTVKKETKAPPVPYKPGKLTPRKAIPLPKPKATPTPQEKRQIERKVMRLAMRASKPDLPKSNLPEDETGDEQQRTQQQRRPAEAPKTSSTPPRRRQLSMKDLKLSDDELAKSLGTRVNDALQGVEEGEQTLLNSKRWRFASFFNRVKRQVAQNWHPGRVYRRRDPQGNIYGFRDRLTILRVRLSPSGELKEVHVEKACGVQFLDDEAISAFRAAEPFPNPPKGLVNKDSGLISFRFGFHFEISRRPSFRIFRFKN